MKNNITHTPHEYVLTRRIGRGGFSEVRLGKIRNNKKERYAVKIVDLKKPKSQRIGRQPHWEIDLLKKLENSDHVIQLYDFKIIENDCIFMVLELGGQSLDVLGKSLRRGINGKMQAKSIQSRNRFKQCLRAVQQVHELGKIIIVFV